MLVRSTRTDGRVALFEQDARHPDGEVFVASQTPVKVGNTPLVHRRLSEGEIEIVETKPAKPAPSTPAS